MPCRAQLLGAELQRHRQVHGGGLAVEFRGLILPLLQRLQRRLAQERRAGKHFHRADVSVRVNQSVNLNVPRHVLGLGHLRIGRRNGFDKLRGLDVTAYRNGGGWRVGTRRAQRGWDWCVALARWDVNGEF